MGHLSGRSGQPRASWASARRGGWVRRLRSAGVGARYTGLAAEDVVGGGIAAEQETAAGMEGGSRRR
jgi:hypothetical protein